MAFFISAAAYGALPPAGSTYTPEDVVFLSLGLAYAVLFSLWGTRRIALLVDRLRPVYAAIVPAPQTAEASWPFRSIEGSIGPLGITAVFTVMFAVPELLVRGPSSVSALAVPVLFVSALPGSTLIWVYGGILWGLNRLGTADLRLAPFEEDASLGLGPFGTLAAVSFVFIIAFYVPIVIGRELRTALFELVSFASIVVLLFLSVYRLHRRLVAERRKHLLWARHRYGRAFRAAMGDGEKESIRERAAGLQLAAEAERRAAAIQTWPFDVSAFRIIGAIVSSVLAAMVARLMLSRVGL
jgi:hypothetical protein